MQQKVNYHSKCTTASLSEWSCDTLSLEGNL